MLTSWWRRASLLAVIVGVVGLAGCSSGGGTSAQPATPTSASAPSEATSTTPGQVATGLRKIDQIAQQIAGSAATDKAKAASLDGQIEPLWHSIEDTVKGNDPTTYLAMEDNFPVLANAVGSGDATMAAKGSAAISAAVQAYLAKYPG